MVTGYNFKVLMGDSMEDQKHEYDVILLKFTTATEIQISDDASELSL